MTQGQQRMKIWNFIKNNIIIILIIFCVVLLTAFSLYLLIKFPSLEELNKVAGLVQAVGSILAIMMVALIGIYQSNKNWYQAVRMKKQTKIEQAEKIITLLNIPITKIQRLRELIKEFAHVQADDIFKLAIANIWQDYINCVFEIKNINMQNYPNSECYRESITYTERLGALIKIIETKAIEETGVSPSNPFAIADMFLQYSVFIKNIESFCDSNISIAVIDSLNRFIKANN